jgi:peptidoglycan/LPS O-acetylase OafA/YrhL
MAGETHRQGLTGGPIAGSGANTHRTDIQGLRAVAVLLVVIFHLWPLSLPGGYVGVDVFFVVSGFLITAHLVGEVERSGTVSLPSFWARRARRLLPASLTVLAVTAVTVWLVAPAGLLNRFLGEIMASVLYVENVALAGSSVDYLAAEAIPSPVQHFWSLSAEEQFYLVWPVLILIAAALAALCFPGAGSPRRVIAGMLGVLIVCSFAWSVIYTQRDPSPAYFLATTRAWEFGAGGLLATLSTAGAPRATNGRERTRAAVAWLGLVAIVSAALMFGGSTPFPGSAALLPVLGTVAVLAARSPLGRFSSTRMLAHRPVQRLGDLSYGIYLWHWPLIVLVPLVLARPLTVADGILILAVTLALAWATERWVEKPIRAGALAVRRPRVTFAVMAVAMSGVVLLPISLLGPAQERLTAEQHRVQALVDENPGCLGAAALNGDRCVQAELTAAAIPDPSVAEASPERCITNIRSSELTACAYGAAEGTGVRSVALVGDSHAEQWLPALAELARNRNWTLFVLAKSSCPFGPDQRFEKNTSADVLAAMNDSCAEWNSQALAWFVEHPEVDTVVTASRARNAVVAEDEEEDWRVTAARQYLERWAALPETVENVMVIRDTPRMREDYLTCMAEAGEDAGDVCAIDAADALERDAAVEAASGGGDRFDAIDLTRYFCPDGVCRPVIGGVLAYRDSHHISWVYARTLAGILGNEMDALTSATPTS